MEDRNRLICSLAFNGKKDRIARFILKFIDFE